MEKYICQKPSKFGNRKYLIGEEIPADLIDQARVPVLKKYGVIASVDVTEPVPEPTPAPVPEPKTEKPGKKGGGKKDQK